MSHFIEVHLQYKPNSRPCILNTDWVEYVTPLDDGSLIHLGTVNVDGQQGGRFDSRAFTLLVTEDYYTLKELFHCK